MSISVLFSGETAEPEGKPRVRVVANLAGGGGRGWQALCLDPPKLFRDEGRPIQVNLLIMAIGDQATRTLIR